MLVPAPVYIVTDELGSVMAGSEGHIADVFRHIIDAVWSYLTARERGEVMVKGLEPSVGQSLPLALEVPKHLFLLGVNAYNRKAYGLYLFTDECNALELFIPVIHLFHRQFLVERAFPKFKGIKDLTGKVGIYHTPLQRVLL